MPAAARGRFGGGERGAERGRRERLSALFHDERHEADPRDARYTGISINTELGGHNSG